MTAETNSSPQGIQGVLLVNLGSPASTDVADVRAYLAQFLMDEHVLDYPTWLRWLIVHAFILPKRPARSAEAYRTIWWEEGSPLIVLSQRQRDLLQAAVDFPVALAMTYGAPSIADGLRQLTDQDVEDVLVITLYPQYAMSTSQSVEAAVRKAVTKFDLNISFLPPFYANPQYIAALLDTAKEHLRWDYGHILFSYHGLPTRQLRKTDPTGSHCLQSEDCCQVASPAHDFCYRHQAIRTTQLFTESAGISAEKYSFAFQSRLGRDEWLSPSTASRIEQLGQQGVRKLLVICPSFVTDCLETLEEIEIGGAEIFAAAGGQAFRMIPCLNTNPLWIAALKNWVEQAFA